MRRYVALAAVLTASLLLPATWAQAQTRPTTGGRGQPAQDDSAEREAKRRREAEFAAPTSRLPGERNVGPCPFVKVLYDAGRYVEFEGGREAAAAVGFTGEIEGISADCSYQDDEPISVDMNVGFALGKGPRAQGDTKAYTYWIAVTHRNRAVLAKEYFTLPVRFPTGQDRVTLNERIAGIVIPRANATTSGSNFEILIGFEVTPQMAEFNRDGKRFRVNVASAAAPAQGATAPAPQ